MITQNKPDREEVIEKLKEFKLDLEDFPFNSEALDRLISSALSLLTQQREDEKDRARLDWLEKNKACFECTSDSSDFVIFVPESRGSGPLAPLFNSSLRQGIDSAMASTSTTEEESA